jgi:4-alpha-glucanotransferase
VNWTGSRYVNDRCTLFQRESGILLDIPSLPGGYGIGEIGPHALKFLKILHDTGQKLWHIVSLRTLHHERLYTGTSYGGNTLLISFAWLRDDGLVDAEELLQFKESLEKVADHRETICDLRRQFLCNVAENFEKRASKALITDFLAFQKYHRLWLYKFSLFQSLKEEFGGTPWYTWPEHLRIFDRSAIEVAQKQLVEKIQKKNILQFLFMRYWKRLRDEANALGIRIILTVPVFVLHDSYEVWANQSLFFVNSEGKMTAVSGLPSGQGIHSEKLFQGPQYRWNRVKEEQYKFWVNRLRRELQIVDIALLENFHAMFQCCEFPVEVEGDPRCYGRWVPTGDQHLFAYVFEVLQTKNIIASDIHMSCPKMEYSMRCYELASAVVLPFCFSDKKGATQIFPQYYTQRHIAYTSNYFSDSLLKWLKPFDDHLPMTMYRELQCDADMDPHHVIRNILSNLCQGKAGAVMTPLQDILECECDSDAFLSWRFRWEQIDDAAKARLSQLSQR